MSSYDQLQTSLGAEGMQRFLQHARPLFQKQQATLLLQLQQADWQGAAQTAHKIQGTIQFFSPELKEDLMPVVQGDIMRIQAAGFQQALAAKFNTVLQTVFADRP